MKKICFNVLLTLFTWVSIQAQSCLPEGITFSSQSQVDSFWINYPGCSTIVGNVEIGYAADNYSPGLSAIHAIGGDLITHYGNIPFSLQGFDHLEFIGGNLRIEYSPLEEFNLPQLKVIRGSLIVNNCVNLKSFITLGDLDSLGGIAINNCPKIYNLYGLEHIYKMAGNLQVWNPNGGLLNFNGLNNLTSISGSLSIQSQGLASFTGLSNLSSIGGSFHIAGTPALVDFDKFNNLTTIGGDFTISSCSALKDFAGLSNLSQLHGLLNVSNNGMLENFNGLHTLSMIGELYVRNNANLQSLSGLNLTRLTGNVNIAYNTSLTNLTDLNSVKSIGGSMYIIDNPLLNSLAGLDNIDTISGHFFIQSNLSLVTLGSLHHLRFVGGGLNLYGNTALVNIDGLDSLNTIGGGFWIDSNGSLSDLSTFSQLESIGSNLEINSSDSIVQLTGLENVHTVGGDLSIYYNNAITDISALANIESIGGSVWMFNNPSLTTCAIYPVCNQIFNRPEFLNISDNGPGCNTPLEVELECGGIPVLATVRLNNNTDCQSDSATTVAEGVLVQLSGSVQQAIRPTQSDGTVEFGYLNTGFFSMSLPQFPTANWEVCQDTFWYFPDTIQDTIRTNFLLKPLNQCPDLSVDVWLPPVFRGCLATSTMQVVARNAGTITAEAVQLAIVMPTDLLLVSSVPTLATQNGDTLFFDLGDLSPFVAGTVNMVVRTSCDNFLIGQTLCVEAFSSLANPCASNLPAFSEVRLFSQCLNDTTVLFTLKNVGMAPTQSVHDYVIIEDEVILMQANFNLDPLQSINVEVPTSGATYRMEATKYDDGTLTAIARENCGGLNPGFITAYWLNDGRQNYDFDCRQVIAAYDPNQKTAIPTGVGPEHLLASNKSIQYTIEFQNTGTDTAFRVLIRDVLPPQLNVLSFRPGFASNPYTWQIIGGDTLEVLFSPIMLPDSNVNEATSHGWFSFDIDQKPDLPDGTTIENTASIIFDYNPPIVTNTVLHTIGKLTVSADEPQGIEQTWQVLSNPARYAATFHSKIYIPGIKRFELTDALGRVVRTEHFDGQEFEFQRGLLSGGLYYFHIISTQGQVSSGKIVITQ